MGHLSSISLSKIMRPLTGALCGVMLVALCLGGCRNRRQDPNSPELTRSLTMSYPEESSLPQGAIARFGNRTLHLDGNIRAMTLDPVERFLIATDGGRLEIFEPQTGVRERAILPHMDRVDPSDMKSLNFARGGEHLIGLSNDTERGVLVWSMPARRLLYSLPLQEVYGRLLATSPSEPRFATIDPRRGLVVRELDSGEVVVEAPLGDEAQGGRVYTALLYTEDGSQILMLRRDGWEVRDASSGEVVRQHKERAGFSGAAFFPGETRAALVRSAGNQVEIWDIAQGKSLKDIKFSNKIVRLERVVVDPITRTVLVQTAGRDPLLLGLDEQVGERFRVSSQDFAVSRDGMVAISSGRALRRYRVEPERGELVIIETVAGHAEAPTQLTWDEAGDVFWSASSEGAIIRWELKARTGEIFDVGLSPGRVAFALDTQSAGIVVSGKVRQEGTQRDLLRWIDRDTREVVWSVPLDEPIQALHMRDDGTIIALSERGVVTQYSVYGARTRRWPLGGKMTQVVGYNDEFTRLALYEEESKQARYWDLEGGRLMGRRSFIDDVSCAWYKRSTAACARSHSVGEVLVGEVWYETHLDRFSHGFQQIRGMAFSGLGDRLAIWGLRPSRKNRNDQVWLFDLRFDEERPRLDPIALAPEDGLIQTALFHPDARRFLTAHDNGLITLWDLNSAPTRKQR